MRTLTRFRWLLPALLLTSLAVTSCGRCKDHDPRPRNKCGSSTTPPAGGNS